MKVLLFCLTLGWYGLHSKAQEYRGAFLFGLTQSLSVGTIKNRNDTFFPFANMGIQIGLEWKQVYVSSFLQFNNYHYPRLMGVGFAIEPRFELSKKVDAVLALQTGWWSFQGQFSGKVKNNVQLGAGIGLKLRKNAYWQTVIQRNNNFYIEDGQKGPFYFNHWYITTGIFLIPHRFK